MRLKLPPHRNALQRGFTLIELLISIVIISVLVGIGIMSFLSSQMKGRDSQRKSDLANISRSLEMYYNDKGRYPDATGGLINGLDWGTEFKDDAVTNGAVYMVKLPSDPGAGAYYYTIDTNGTAYRIYAILENTKDRAVPLDGDGLPTTYVDTDCGGAACNYGIASPNVSL
jgi:general secretion pathway protein G